MASLRNSVVPSSSTCYYDPDQAFTYTHMYTRPADPLQASQADVSCSKAKETPKSGTPQGTTGSSSRDAARVRMNDDCHTHTHTYTHSLSQSRRVPAVQSDRDPADDAVPRTFVELKYRRILPVSVSDH